MNVEDILEAEGRSMGRPCDLLDVGSIRSSEGHTVVTILYRPAPHQRLGEDIMVETRVAIYAGDNKHAMYSGIVATKWVDAAAYMKQT